MKHKAVAKKILNSRLKQNYEIFFKNNIFLNKILRNEINYTISLQFLTLFIRSVYCFFKEIPRNTLNHAGSQTNRLCSSN